MFHSFFVKEGFDNHYIAARSQMDDLCERIIHRQISALDARKEYATIESEFNRMNPDMASLFKMIYGSRVERLCLQFLDGGTV